MRSELFKATNENKLAHPNYIVVKQKNMVSNSLRKKLAEDVWSLANCLRWQHSYG